MSGDGGDERRVVMIRGLILVLAVVLLLNSYDTGLL